MLKHTNCSVAYRAYHIGYLMIERVNKWELDFYKGFLSFCEAIIVYDDDL